MVVVQRTCCRRYCTDAQPVWSSVLVCVNQCCMTSFWPIAWVSSRSRPTMWPRSTLRRSATHSAVQRTEWRAIEHSL